MTSMAAPAPAPRDQVAADVYTELSQALDSVQAAGTFAAFAKIKEAIIKPFFVQDVGPVDFPLQESTARQLIEKARQAPYGKGSETFVDTSVRNTWELDASQLDHMVPQWTPTVDSACKWAAKQLGITVPITAQLYKMLIYEEGAMFKAHTDTEKVPGMFGTLVICLPSEHQGGDLVLKHRDVTKIFKTSEAQPSMACWYSDVSHEVLPVTSGRRWVLTYNLAISHPLHSRPCAALNAPRHDKVRRALAAWLGLRSREGDGAHSGYLYYLLDHTYTEANISLNALKGADRSRMQCLNDVCSDHNATLLLGVLEKEEFGGCAEVYDGPHGGRGGGGRRGYLGDNGEDDDDIEDEDSEWHPFVDVFETDVSIKKLVNPEGRTLRTGLKIDTAELEGNLIQDYADPFETADHGERDYSGFTGNEGVSARHWYRVTIAVIVANDAVDEFLTKAITRTDAQGLLPKYLLRCSDPKNRASVMKTVQYLAQRAWSSASSTSAAENYVYIPESEFSMEVVLQFLETVLLCQQYELFSKALGWFRTRVGTPLFALVKTAAAEELFDFTKVKDSLLQNLSICSLAARPALLSSLVSLNGDNRSLYIRDWAANEAVPAAIDDCLRLQKVTEADGSALATMVEEYHDLDYLSTKLIPAIEKRAALTPFALAAFLKCVSFADRGADQMPVHTAVLELCKPLLESVINSMDVGTLRSKNGAAQTAATTKAQRYSYYQEYRYSRSEPQALEFLISPSLLAECVSRCIQLGWNESSMLLCRRIVDRAGLIPVPEFRHLWIPFIHRLMSTLEENRVPLSTPRYQEVACAILELYLDVAVGKEPSGEVNYSQRPVNPNCYCTDCPAMDRFLASNQREWQFPAAERRRRHIQTVLESRGAGCSFNTLRYSSPHTLVVTKNIDSGARAKREWTDKFTQAWDDITKFDQEKLKVLLGAHYERITSMRHLRFPGTGTAAQAQQTIAERPRQAGGTAAQPIVIRDSPFAGMKRRAVD
ncbi:hypothetical protein B0T26DRAFT_830139 [Lasiosphaeria miniovina]|uniref:Prolyl 4-hydroxylase alpha subunit domain-containing protein n=1 Tax=Lasiosphaeria miniovina TaxID=1954250 RepID=A0AA40DVM6_9PEZI|nr:uncharacterized protein B0T26DRAFT_830139 [Lasiosphaeria miniovina]KAK0718024.1 hypothetical protein B0T26DRAFT_830139 [Lasiosphaeria miniovina]